ncbi:hypothetical protein F511_44740 [Dorcoceras hygrometricum]|uniref:SAM domain-containing protein n=1 Tax=Dorcoceras hygrometricum TaxID=472368 RepID=A0A2Z6ZYP8_9LAMI|nr:hypothetical protein F511_44740 [Dorcoceras hygrometricum]
MAPKEKEKIERVRSAGRSPYTSKPLSRLRDEDEEETDKGYLNSGGRRISTLARKEKIRFAGRSPWSSNASYMANEDEEEEQQTEINGLSCGGSQHQPVEHPSSSKKRPRGLVSDEFIDISGPKNPPLEDIDDKKRQSRREINEGNENAITPMDLLKAWLDVEGLGKYRLLFDFHSVNHKILPYLSIRDLKEMGVTDVGSRRMIHRYIRNLRTKFSFAGY